MSLQMKLVSDLLKSIFDTSLRLSRSFFGKRNWFGQKVTTIPYSDQLPVLKVFLPFAQTVNRPVCQCKWWYSICGVKNVLIKIKFRKKPLISIWYPKWFPIYQINSNKTIPNHTIPYLQQLHTRWAFARKHHRSYGWKEHRCYGYMSNRAFRSRNKKIY